MMLTRRILFGLAIVLLAATNVVAQDDDKKAKKMLARATKSTTASMMKAFAKADLTEDQKTKAMAIIEEYVPELMEAKKAQDSVLTEDHMEKRKAAYAKSKEDGMKGKEANAAAFEAMGLSDDEKGAFMKAKKEVNRITNAMKGDITELLTDEQKAALPKKGKGKGKKKKMAEEPQAVSLKLPNMT